MGQVDRLIEVKSLQGVRFKCLIFAVIYINVEHFTFPPTAVCGGELDAPSGTISSPNYPNLYPHSRVCRWELVVSPGRRVTLTINDLRLEDSGTSCAYDYVEVSPFHRSLQFSMSTAM